MSTLPACPVCGEDDLWLVCYTLENGGLHYKVACHSCGVEFHHERFYGYNAVMSFFERPSCENLAPFADEGERVEWKCSRCGSERVCKEGEPAYGFCPDCGAGVSQW